MVGCGESVSSAVVNFCGCELNVIKLTRFRDICLCLAVLCALNGGCGMSEEEKQRKLLENTHGTDLKTVVPLGGVIRVNGKPEPGVYVTLHSADGTKRIAVRAPYTNDEGTFEFTTYQQADGVEPGKYKLTFEWFDLVEVKKEGIRPEGPDKLNGAYKDPQKSEFSVDLVEDEPQSELEFDLKTSG